MLNTIAVIVTYANRFAFLKKTVNSALLEGVSKVIIVDNNSDKESKEKLKIFEQKLKKITVIYLDDNYGSAGGYKIGIEKAFNDKDCDYIWLLDDDNRPKKNSLKKLLAQWKSFSFVEQKEVNLALLSYRSDRNFYKQAVLSNQPNYMLGGDNSFLGFNLKNTPGKLINKLIQKFRINMFTNKKEPVLFGKVAVAPYGGLFFQKNIITKIGLPNEDFFLYADDYDWTYRIKNIYLILDSEIEDIDKSWNLKDQPISSFHAFLRNNDKIRSYYSIRNRVYFEKKILTNPFLYKINKFIYIAAIYLYSVFKNKNFFSIFIKAVNSGELGELKKVEI